MSFLWHALIVLGILGAITYARRSGRLSDAVRSLLFLAVTLVVLVSLLIGVVSGDSPAELVAAWLGWVLLALSDVADTWWKPRPSALTMTFIGDEPPSFEEILDALRGVGLRVEDGQIADLGRVDVPTVEGRLHSRLSGEL